MKNNGTCYKCGKPCFEMFSSQECCTVGCSNYRIDDSIIIKKESYPLLSALSKLTDNAKSGTWVTNAGIDWRQQPIYKHFIGNAYEGPPKATAQCTTEQLQRMKIIGLYWT